MILAASPTPSPSASGLQDWFAIGPIDWVAIGALATLFTAVVAVGIAIWGPWLYALFFKPELEVTIEMHPPDCMKMQAVLDSGPQRTTSYTNSYQCRLLVKNAGRREAKNVEVRLRRLRVVANGGPGREDRDFIPLNLKWSHTEQITASRIEPKLDKHCSLCYTTEYSRTSPLLVFVTEVDPTPIRPGVWANRKAPGNYLADIVLAADNAKAVYKTLRISFAGWFDDEEIMFERGLRITVVEN